MSKFQIFLKTIRCLQSFEFETFYFNMAATSSHSLYKWRSFSIEFYPIGCFAHRCKISGRG